MSARHALILLAVVLVSGTAGWFARGPDRGAEGAVEPAATSPAADFDFTFTDLAGRAGSIGELRGRPVVIAMRDSGCPVAERHGPGLAALEREFGGQVKFLYLNASRHDAREEIGEEIGHFGFTGRYIADPSGELARRIAARTASEVFLLDAEGRLAYRGAVDDQHDIADSRADPRQNWLRDALGALLAGQPVAVAETEAEGCELGSGAG
jgi:hypothetical protein